MLGTIQTGVASGRVLKLKFLKHYFIEFYFKLDLFINKRYLILI